MEPKRSDQILDEWSSVARSAMPPGAPSAASTTRVAGPGISLAGGAVLVVAAIAVFALLGNRAGPSGPGAPLPSPTPTPAPSIAVAIPVPCPTPPPVGSPEPCPTPNAPPSDSPAAPPTATPEASPAASPEPCYRLSVPLSWDGAAGQRIATITVSNPTNRTCTIDGMTRVQYVDGRNNVLIDGPVPAGGERLSIPPHGQVSTMVEVGNYCGPEPQQPVGILFRFANGGFFLVGSPASQANMSVPPCNGPGQPGSIQMHPWSAS
jgi:hypothetical protein